MGIDRRALRKFPGRKRVGRHRLSLVHRLVNELGSNTAAVDSKKEEVAPTPASDQSATWTYVVIDPIGNEYTICGGPAESVRNLRASVAALVGLPTRHHVTLVLEGEVIHDSMNQSSAGLSDGTIFTVLINSSTCLIDVEVDKPAQLYDSIGGERTGEIACGHRFELLTESGEWSEIRILKEREKREDLSCGMLDGNENAEDLTPDQIAWVRTENENGKINFAPQGSQEAREAAMRRFCSLPVEPLQRPKEPFPGW